MLDNCFNRISDWDAAQKLADESDSQLLHTKLDYPAQLYCPVIQQLGLSYQWNLAQIEYSTDIVFRRQVELWPPTAFSIQVQSWWSPYPSTHWHSSMYVARRAHP